MKLTGDQQVLNKVQIQGTGPSPPEAVSLLCPIEPNKFSFAQGTLEIGFLSLATIEVLINTNI